MVGGIFIFAIFLTGRIKWQKEKVRTYQQCRNYEYTHEKTAEENSLPNLATKEKSGLKFYRWVTVVTVKIFPLNFTDLPSPSLGKSFHNGICRVTVTFRVTVEIKIG